MSISNIIAANWKLNHGIDDALHYLNAFQFKELDEMTEVIFFPPLTHLFLFKDFLKQYNNYHLGAQNCSEYVKGAYTGEISTKTLKELTCQYVLIGHSERRQLFKEEPSTLGRKLACSFEHKLTPVFCIGESESERNEGQTKAILKRQLQESFKLCSSNQLENKFIIAYEPIWAIGTGLVATSKQVQETHAFIRKELALLTSQEIPIIYGGSVKPENARELLDQQDVNGLLVGGASLKPDSFSQIISA